MARAATSWQIPYRSGRCFRTFNVIDEFNRKGLRIEVDTRLLAARVIRVTRPHTRRL